MEISPWESRQIRVLIKRYGADPSLFRLRKFERLDSGGWHVRVSGPSGATAYECDVPHAWAERFADDLRTGVFGNMGTALSTSVAEGLHEVQQALFTRGLPAALKVLNERVPHRFTAVYRRDDQHMRNLAFTDKHPHLGQLDLSSVALHDSFCQFVLRDGLFLTQDSAGDPRLTEHPYCGVMGCYVGVPIQRDGEMVGSLCHFDLRSHCLQDEEFLLLDQVARILPPVLGR